MKEALEKREENSTKQILNKKMRNENEHEELIYTCTINVLRIKNIFPNQYKFTFSNTRGFGTTTDTIVTKKCIRPLVKWNAKLR